ncbi:putative ribonuclease H-like domain-containing protein [Tanacetum coccineum]
MPENEQVWQDELEMMITQEVVTNAMNDESRQAFEEEKRRIASQKKATQATSTNQLSTDRPFVNAGRSFASTDRSNTPNVSVASTSKGANANESSFVYFRGKIPIDASTLPNADLPINLNMPDLEDAFDTLPNDRIFNGAYDDDKDVGAVADLNNIDNTIAVSPIPTLRIHKDHPKGQILIDPTLAVQTRGKIQKASLAQQALVSYIHKQKRTNYKDHQNCLFACFLSQEEPKTISQALQDESWVEAMQEELLQFKLQQVWILVDLPFGNKAISTKWVFINKRDERSIIVKNKARLVAQGHTQEEGINYDEVFAPVARIEAIRLFLAFASYKRFLVYQTDVKSDFLYGIIKEEVYVHQPPGFVNPAHPNKVYKEVKALYGLHQAPRAWYETLSSFSLENGYRRCTIDKTLFIKKNKSDIMLVQVCVDDIIFGSTKKSMCTEFKEAPDIMFLVLPRAKKLSQIVIMQEPVLTGNQQLVDVNFLVEDSYLGSARSRQLWQILLLRQNMLQLLIAVGKISMDLRMDRSSPGKYNSSMVFYMANLKYSDKHNMVAFLKKPNESVGFTEVVDFLKGTSLRYALTHNPTIYDSLVKQFWQTVTVRTVANGTQQLVASIDSKEYILNEASVRNKLQLEDATGIYNLSDAEIYAGLATLGYVTEAEKKGWYLALTLTKKLFANMKRGYAGDIIPLLPAMLEVAAVDQGEGSAQPAEPHHTPIDPITSTSQPPIPSPPHPSPPPHSLLQSPPHSPLQSPPHSPPHSPH